MEYSIKRNGLYLQGVKPNNKYCPSACAPTMGKRHDVSEFSTVWAKEPKYFEWMTASNYIKTLMDEYRWKDKKAVKFTVEPKE